MLDKPIIIEKISMCDSVLVTKLPPSLKCAVNIIEILENINFVQLYVSICFLENNMEVIYEILNRIISSGVNVP